jgi:hypothetical protein
LVCCFICNIYFLNIFLAPTREERAALNKSARDFDLNESGVSAGSLDPIQKSASDRSIKFLKDESSLGSIVNIKHGNFNKEDNAEVEHEEYYDDEIFE